ncbi:DUF1622 domain-containing protein [Phormidium sp. CLA17]|uniref:DUF1622 domain-containing protein n=1 Tax=Leptolyngbya sp. Cla-17 TaxID=2803751 RepID=UPI001492E4A6|nr:DUF1622 domain-containing protein [Leptolyngbya sp. Cla-17]MBM0743118.1 DUF1622 domain-containing protein [Leptolyngbya sp. Cla-17]
MIFDVNSLATSSGEIAKTQSSELTRLVESLLQECTLLLQIILEFIAISIIAISLVIALQQLWQKARRRRLQDAQQAIRLELGLSLALALEFLLAADIAATAVSPSWDAIARLAAITGIRTFLNFFLQKEVRELEAMNQQIRENSEL